VVRIEIEGLPAVQAALGSVVVALGRPLMLVLDQELKTLTARNFVDERDPVSGVKWPSVRPLTMAIRPSGGGHILWNRGRLLNSIISRRPIITKDSVTIGTNVAYARVHHGKNGSPFTVIRPRNARKLAIPMNREAARAGSARRWIAANSASYFINESGIFKTYARRKPRMMFLRVDFVRVPKRRFLGVGRREADILNKKIVGYMKAILVRMLTSQGLTVGATP